MKSLENDRELTPRSDNPFDTEIRLYEREFNPSDIKVTVVVPDFYHVALPNVGHQMVEYQLNQIPGIFSDRTYLAHDYSLLKEKPDIQPELIFISMSYEGSAIRAMRVLDLFGCPLDRKDRKQKDPIVVMGGWSVSRNPMPYFDIADIIGIGDSEHIISDIAKAYQENRKSKQNTYEALVNRLGIIIPSRYRVATQNGYLTEWESYNASGEIFPSRSSEFPHSWYLSPETDYNDIGYYDGKTFFSMEIVEACASKCAFCASGFRAKGRDFREPVAIADVAELGRKHGVDLVKLWYPANSSLSVTKAIMRELMARGFSTRVGSSKAEFTDDEFIALIGQSGQEKIAFAPETGDYELRKRIGKPGMTDDVLRSVIGTSVEVGIPNLDLYLIMNIPGEASDSFQKTIDLVGELYHLAKSKGLPGRVRISAPNFFPKAWTPFQYAPAGGLEQYAEKIEILEKDLGEIVTVSSMKGSVDLMSQNILSRGGVEVGQLLIEVYRILRNRELESGNYVPDSVDDWRNALSALGLDENIYFNERSVDKPLPWHHIHLNTSIDLKNLILHWELFQNRRNSLVVID